jgi:hypothetical protein
VTQDNPDRSPERKKDPDPTWEGEEIDRIFDEINRFGFHPKEE